jgi:hypothetical protein
MEEAVRTLKEAGVQFPPGYPPANVNPRSSEFRGVWAQLETLTLLTRVVEPWLLELASRDVEGDTDIIIRTSPPYRLQVKGPFPTNIREDDAILRVVRSVRTDVLKRFLNQNPTPWNGVFSTIRVHLGKDGEEYSGNPFC